MNTTNSKLHRNRRGNINRARYSDKQGYTNALIHYIVVHTTGTKPDMLLSDFETLPYHYVVTKAGRLINLKPVQVKDGTIEVALVGGMDKEGGRVDCRTPRQNETLFNALILLSERYPYAKIVGADKVYVYPYANPGFDLQGWIAGYLPVMLEAA